MDRRGVIKWPRPLRAALGIVVIIVFCALGAAFTPIALATSARASTPTVLQPQAKGHWHLAKPAPVGLMPPNEHRLVIVPSQSLPGRVIKLRTSGRLSGYSTASFVSLEVPTGSGWRTIAFMHLSKTASGAFDVAVEQAIAGTGVVPGNWLIRVPPVPRGSYRVREDIFDFESKKEGSRESTSTLYARLTVL